MSPAVQAFVDFDSASEAERAITTKDRQVFAQKFGDRYVRLVQASPVPNPTLDVGIGSPCSRHVPASNDHAFQQLHSH